MPSSLDTTAYKSTVTGAAMGDWAKSADEYNWAKDQFAKNQGTSDKVVNRALDTGANFGDWAKTDRGDYETNVRPAMKEQMDFARDYTTPGRMAANRASAIGGANIASQRMRKNSQDQLMSYGINPSSGRFAGLDAALDAKGAATAAAAGTQSDRATEMLGQQYLSNAIKTGQVLPGQVANEANVGMAAGNQAVNAGLATTASGSATKGTPIQWAGLGNDMIKQWLAGDVAQDASNQGWEKISQGSSSGTGAAIGAGAGLLGGVGKVAGMFGGMGGSSSSDPMIMNAGAPAGGYNITADQLPGYSAARGGAIRRFRAGGAVPRPGEKGRDPALIREPFTDLEEEAEVPQWDGAPPSIDEDDEQTPMQPRDEYDEDELPVQPPFIRRFAKGGAAHDLLGMAGSAAGMLIPIPVVGPMIGKFAGHALGDLIEGNTGEIGDDAQRDATFGMADPDSPGGFNPQGIFGAGQAGGSAAMSFMQGGGEPTSEVSPGGQPSGQPSGQQGNMVPPDASPSGGANTDDVHAMVSVDEFVMPKDVSKWYGEKYLQGLIEKARKEMAGATAKPEAGQVPQAMAISPPSFRSEGASA